MPQSPGQGETGRPRLIADPQFGARMGLSELGEHLLIRLRLPPLSLSKHAAPRRRAAIKSRPLQRKQPIQQPMNTITIHAIGAVKRYTDAYIVAKVTVGIGNAIKIAGLCVGCGIAVLSGLIAVSSLNSNAGIGGIGGLLFGGIGVCFGVVVGLILFVFGVLLAAQGQTLMATLDTAVNSSPFLAEHEKAKAMSLRVIEESSSIPPTLPT